MGPLVEKIKEKIKPIIQAKGMELFDLTYRREGKNRILRIIIDKNEGSVSIGDCSIISEQISQTLDMENIVDEKFFLEVTSPGLDRPLRDWRDFSKFKNKLIKFQTHSLINDRRNFLGRIKEATNNHVIINIRESGDLKFGYHEIAKANLEIEF